MFVPQDTQRYALYNRDVAFDKYCNEDDIILDLDADDWLIGNQVFQLINALYQSN